MSWFGWMRRIGHLFLGGHNASHIKGLPLEQITSEQFQQLSDYIETKYRSLPPLQQKHFNAVTVAFQAVRLDFKNFPQMITDRDAAKAAFNDYNARVAPTVAESSQELARLEVANETFNYEVNLLKRDLRALGNALKFFRGVTKNFNLTEEVCHTLAPIVHGILNICKVDHDQYPEFEIF